MRLKHLEGERTEMGTKGDNDKCYLTAYYKYIVCEQGLIVFMSQPV